ncbi:MAG: ribosomal protein S18-alanine N-acetyltransferase [Caldiserica bacterium]|nr:ribosomal protein S18-alanine N-acetyltransferase [Caldisericota bacterium]
MTLTRLIMLRAASVRDLKAIWEIEEASYAAPWPKETFFVDITFNADAKYFVALVDKRIVGFIGGWFKEGQLHIVNVATLPASRKSGVAKQLVLFLLDLARDLKMESAFLEVRRSNVAAQRLYEGLGFAVTGLKPMYYPDNLEDGLLMTKELRSAHTGD